MKGSICFDPTLGSKIDWQYEELKSHQGSPEVLYRTFADPAALAVWLVPGEMTGKIYAFEARVGGGYRMSLFYPATDRVHGGTTSEREDRFTARFVTLTPQGESPKP